MPQDIGRTTFSSVYYNYKKLPSLSKTESHPFLYADTAGSGQVALMGEALRELYPEALG